MNRIAKEAEDAALHCDVGTYRITRRISAKYKGFSSGVKDRNGRLLTKENEIKERWKEHFTELLNREPPVRPPRIGQGTVSENIEDGNITREEIVSALRKTKNNKAPGIDNITSEMLKADLATSVAWLKRLFDKIWLEEKTPSEWSKGIVVTIPKKGGHLPDFPWCVFI